MRRVVVVLVVALVAALMLGGAAFAGPNQLEAEDMRLPDRGYAIKSSDAASGGKFVNLRKNGTLSTNFNGAVDKLTVRAKGRRYEDIAPKMVVKVDGTVVMRRAVKASRFKDFTKDLPNDIASGSHTLEVSYNNDAGRRALHVDVVTIVEPGSSAPPVQQPDTGGGGGGTGGGGGGSVTTPPPVSPPPSAPSQPPSTPPPPPPPPADDVNWCSSSPEKPPLAAEERQMILLHNQARSERGAGRLCVDSRLVKAARGHAQYMNDSGNFSHGNFGARVSAQGYSGSALGENIAMGSGSWGTPQNIFNMWMESSGHRSNILNSNYTDLGIGKANGYWVAVFARR